MRKDSELFLKKLLKYKGETGKDRFQINIRYFMDIPNIINAINDILDDLIVNACITSKSQLLNSEYDILINLTLDGIEYFNEKESKKYITQNIFNVNGGQVNIATSRGRIYPVTNKVEDGGINISIQDKNIKFENNKKQDYIENWNSRMFLHKYNNERPVTLADAFIVPDYKKTKENKRIGFLWSDNLDNIIYKFIQYDRTTTMLIAGDPGTGKSSIVSWIANIYKKDNRLYILRFRDWDLNELKNGLLKAIYFSFNCKKADLENKILILDGFDELKLMSARENLLDEFFNDILDFQNFKCIITSRPNYINISDFQNVFSILPFNLKKIKTFCKKINNIEFDKNKIDYDNLQVLGIPVILYMAIMSNIDITKKATKSELYNRIFAEKGGIFDRFSNDGIGYDSGSSALRNKGNIKKYLEFLRKISFSMFEKGTLSLEKIEYNIPKLEFQGNNISILEFPIKHFFESIEMDIQFIHKSIYEFFVSEYIFYTLYEELSKNNFNKSSFANVLGNLCSKNYISLEICKFLQYKIRKSKLEKYFFAINDTFKMMLRDGMTCHISQLHKNTLECEVKIFGNMLSLMHLWNDIILKFDNSISKYLYFYSFVPLNLTFVDLKNLKLPYAVLRKVNLTGADLTGAILTGADLIEANLTNTKLKGADLTNAILKRANIRFVDFSEVKLIGVDFSESDLRWKKFKEADLRRANLIGAYMDGANLLKANLQRANLSAADLTDADLTDADLTGANLTGANLTRANLTGANLTGAKLINVDIENAILKKADLREVSLKKINLQKFDLEKINLQKASLTNIDLKEANLKGANLTDTDLKCVDLTEADLTKADLRGADLVGTNLLKTKLEGSIWFKEDIYYILYSLKYAIFTYIVIDDNLRMKKVLRKEIFYNKK